MKRYVLGFLFNTARAWVVMIRKNHPAWQAGKWNGVGGEVKPGEDLRAAMKREFHEETGVADGLIEWSHYARLSGVGYQVDCFVAEVPTIPNLHTSSEQAFELPVSDVMAGKAPTLGDTPWLIGMARDFLERGALFANIKRREDALPQSRKEDVAF